MTWKIEFRLVLMDNFIHEWSIENWTLLLSKIKNPQWGNVIQKHTSVFLSSIPRLYPSSHFVLQFTVSLIKCSLTACPHPSNTLMWCESLGMMFSYKSNCAGHDVMTVDFKAGSPCESLHPESLWLAQLSCTLAYHPWNDECAQKTPTSDYFFTQKCYTMR